MVRRWNIKSDKIEGTLLSRALLSRSLGDIGEIPEIAPPSSLADMDAAVERIGRAIKYNEKITVFGDYDADGITASALLMRCLKGLGAEAECRLPARDGDGYGLSEGVVEEISLSGTKLIITVDNGVSAYAEIELAHRLSMDVVVTDHHLVPEKMPRCIVVDPQRRDDRSPYKSLSGVGVALKLAAALEGISVEEALDKYGASAAVGTIADAMPLTGENRAIVMRSLGNIESERGFKRLLEAAGVVDKKVTAETVAYTIAPRINAAGRMANPEDALGLLLSDSDDEINRLAEVLCQCNEERRAAEKDITDSIEKLLAADRETRERPVIVVGGEGYHQGVIGIVCSRLTEKYAKPAIVFSYDKDEARGSGRSAGSFNLYEAVAHCAPLLEKYGGHAAAAGMTAKRDSVAAFSDMINGYAATLPPVFLSVDADGCAELSDLSVENIKELSRLEPFGAGNPRPVFLIGGLDVSNIYPMGAQGSHSRIRFTDGKRSFSAALFGVRSDALAFLMGRKVDALLELSVYSGASGESASAKIVDIRPAGEDGKLFEALEREQSARRSGGAKLLTRERVAAVYKYILRAKPNADYERFIYDDLQSEADAGAVHAALDVLEELSLIEHRDGLLCACESKHTRLELSPLYMKLSQGGAV